MSDPYQVLGLQPGASLNEVRRAYFDQVRAHPPEMAPETFKAIRAAYEQLCALQEQDELFRLREPTGWRPGRVVTVIDDTFHRQDVLVALEGWGDLMPQEFNDDFREVTL